MAGGFLLTLHPFLTHYLGGPTCTAPGTTGTRDSITGSTDGWKQVAYDLSGFAGGQVEVSIAYVSDSGTGGVGAFVDDTRVVVNGVADADERLDGRRRRPRPAARTAATGSSAARC